MSHLPGLLGVNLLKSQVYSSYPIPRRQQTVRNGRHPSQSQGLGYPLKGIISVTGVRGK